MDLYINIVLRSDLYIMYVTNIVIIDKQNYHSIIYNFIEEKYTFNLMIL